MPGILIHGARQVLTLRGANCPRRGTALRNLSIIEDGSILIDDGKIRDVGPTRRIENLAAARSARVVNARGCVVMPGFVDSHMRLLSAASTEVIKQTPAWRLANDASTLLRRCLRYGTTTLEVKSGEGLDERSALKVLRVVAGLAETQPLHLLSTLCGEAKSATAGSCSLRTNLITAFKETSLANYVGVDPALLSDAQFRAIRELASAAGLPVKIHAETAADPDLEDSPAVEHLEHISEASIGRLAESPAVAVLMPGFAFHSQERRYAPARELISRGVAIALASGFDRASNPSFSMPLTIELACRKLAMAPSEAIVAATLNAAHAVGRGSKTGSLEPGKDADVLILETSDFRDLAYETGVNPVDTTIVGGEIVCRNSVSYGDPAAAAAG